MARPDLGTKRTCPTTGRKFYDLNKDPIVSPYTGEVLPRAVAEPAPVRPATGARAKAQPEEDEEVVEAAGPELVSLEEVEADEEKGGAAEEDEAATEDDSGDTFLEEEEEGGDDVADLIEGEIEDDEEG